MVTEEDRRAVDEAIAKRRPAGQPLAFAGQASDVRLTGGSGGDNLGNAQPEDNDTQGGYEAGAASNDQAADNERQMPRSPIANPVIRDDLSGDGHFNTSRTKPDGTRYFHQGVDIEAAPGTPVGSPVAGTIEVRDAYKDGRYGNEFKNVWVRDADGNEYCLGYVTPKDASGGVLVRNGDRVDVGDPVGTVQDRARHDQKKQMRNHIHFQIKRKGRTVDPTPTVQQWIRK